MRMHHTYDGYEEEEEVVEKSLESTKSLSFCVRHNKNGDDEEQSIETMPMAIP
jgi:hypothetical protein